MLRETTKSISTTATIWSINDLYATIRRLFKCSFRSISPFFCLIHTIKMLYAVWCNVDFLIELQAEFEWSIEKATLNGQIMNLWHTIFVSVYVFLSLSLYEDKKKESIKFWMFCFLSQWMKKHKKSYYDCHMPPYGWILSLASPVTLTI